MLTTTEQQISEAFSRYSGVERVKKIRDYAFVHFQSREGAVKAMNALNGKIQSDFLPPPLYDRTTITVIRYTIGSLCC